MIPPVGGVVLLADSTALPGGDGTVDDVLAVVGEAVSGGVRTVVVRDKHRPVDERRALVTGIRHVLAPVGGTVLVALDDADADPLGADGIHLSARSITSCQTRSVLGASAHDAGEIGAAVAAGADYVMVSPIYPTASKPGYGPALGTDGLAALVADSAIPVVALGGITTPDRVTACLTAGAVGVAVMGAIIGAPDPAATAAELVAATTEVRA